MVHISEVWDSNILLLPLNRPLGCLDLLSLRPDQTLGAHVASRTGFAAEVGRSALDVSHQVAERAEMGVVVDS